MVGLIYTFKNKENGKEYIGQTIQPIEVRDYAHYYEAFNQNKEGKFNNALRKYGKGGFIRSILHTVEENDPKILIDKLNELEDLEITKRDTIKNGYNSIKGGRNYVKTCGKTISESKFNGVYKNSNIIEQYTKDGILVGTYNSAMQAERAVNGDNGHILAVCRGKRKTHKGFIWKFGHVKSGELLESLTQEDNQQPSSLNDIEVKEKVQRLTVEESNQ